MRRLAGCLRLGKIEEAAGAWISGPRMQVKDETNAVVVGAIRRSCRPVTIAGYGQLGQREDIKMSPSCTSMSAGGRTDIGAGLRRNLAEAAFLACISNDIVRARRIAKGLSAIAPGSRESVIAYAVADLTVGDIEAAVEQLRPLSDANDAYGLAFEALALHLAGRFSQRDTLLRRVPGGDPDVDGLVAAFGKSSVGHAVERDI